MKSAQSSNTLFALIAVAMILMSATTHLFIYMYTDEITGKAVGSLDLCIGYGPPTITLLTPTYLSILNGTQNISALANHSIGEAYIDFVAFSYRPPYDSYIYLYNDSYDSDAYYNYSWNTLSATDTECNLRVQAAAYMNSSNCGENTASQVNIVSINNFDEEPDWSEFKNNLTTNFTSLNNPAQLNDYFSITDAIIGNPWHGFINYSGINITVEDANLSDTIDIEQGHISLHDTLKCSTGDGARVTFLNITYINPAVYRNGEPCPAIYCADINYSSPRLEFTANFHTGNFTLVENVSTLLQHYDSTDPAGGGLVRYVYENLTFTANWTYIGGPITGNPVNASGAFCEISFNYTANASEFTTPALMNYSNLLLYEYTTTFPIQGTHAYQIVCNGSAAGLETTSAYGTFTITNRPPIFPRIYNTSFPNLSWNEDTTLTGIDLDDYFIDPDGDILEYTFSPNPVLNINVSIDSTTHILSLIPARNWFGNRTVTFIATDPFGAQNNSNLVTLEVIDVPEPTPPPPSGGGGGGGSSTPPPPLVICIENWWCEDWSRCLPTNISKRVCHDASDCGTIENRPNLTRECVYVPTCYDNLKNQGEDQVDCGGPCPACPNCSDNIKNQGEDQVDCGGPCPACPTCSDGIQNQGETGIDCGGPCPACPSCDDGIKNQNETGIDCGGPCPACESPTPLPSCSDGIQNQGETGIDCGGPCAPCEKKSYLWLLISLLALLLFIAAILFRHRIKALFEDLYRRMMLLWKHLHEKKPAKPSLYTIEMQTLLKLNELKEGVGKYHIEDLFGEYRQISYWFASKAYDLDFEFTLQELYKLMTQEKTPQRIAMLTVSMYQKMEEISYRGHLPTNAEFKRMLKQAIKVVEETVLFKISRIHPVEFIKTILADMNYAIFCKRTKTSEKLYFKVVEVYDNMGEDGKKKVYRKMKRMHKKLVSLIKDESQKLNNQNKKPPKKEETKRSNRFDTLKRNIKISSVVLIVLVSALMLVAVLPQSPTPTGLVTLEKSKYAPSILPIPEQKAFVDKEFRLQIHAAAHSESKLHFKDSTRLFEITHKGIIKFTPSKDDIGEYNIAISAASGSKESYTILRLNIIDK